MIRVLLSSVCQPFGPEHGDGFGASYEGSHQILWAQGIFRTRGTTTQWGIDFIAENLQAPTTTLHYPTMEQFVAELRRGYDYVGIAFIAPTLHKMIPMVEAVRRHAPKTKVILGGYGTALGDEVAQYADHLCQGEGVAFMRALLGEPLDAPIVQPVITQVQSLFSLPLGRTGYVFAGLGCPNGCDFCATSHYFGRKHIRLLPDGLTIRHAIERLRDDYPDMVSFWVSDEDLLLNASRGREFLEAMRASDLPPLSLAIFGSVKALSQFRASELVEMGVDWVWIGYEGLRSGYAKMKGRTYEDLFSDLHQHGISVLASMIIGFDYQTPTIIQEEFEELMRLRPTMSQFLIYGPPRGTPLFERLKSEGRLDPLAVDDFATHDGFRLIFEHPHIGADEMAAIQRGLFQQEFERLGPSVFRVVDDWLTGHVLLRDHPAPRVRAKAAKYGQDARRLLPFIAGSGPYVSAPVASWLEGLHQRLASETGGVGWRDRLAAKLASLALKFTDFKDSHGFDRQPVHTRREFHMEPEPQPRAALRGGAPSSRASAREFACRPDPSPA